MAVIQKKSHPRRALRKELFMQICGLLIPGLGNGTKYVILDGITFGVTSYIVYMIKLVSPGELYPHLVPLCFAISIS